MIKYEVNGELSGETQVFNTLKEAKAFIKHVNEFDKRNGIIGDDGNYGEPWTITRIEVEDKA